MAIEKQLKLIAKLRSKMKISEKEVLVLTFTTRAFKGKKVTKKRITSSTGVEQYNSGNMMQWKNILIFKVY